jgi:hypothetical protein
VFECFPELEYIVISGNNKMETLPTSLGKLKKVILFKIGDISFASGGKREAGDARPGEDIRKEPVLLLEEIPVQPSLQGEWTEQTQPAERAG